MIYFGIHTILGLGIIGILVSLIKMREDIQRQMENIEDEISDYRSITEILLQKLSSKKEENKDE